MVGDTARGMTEEPPRGEKVGGACDQLKPAAVPSGGGCGTGAIGPEMPLGVGETPRPIRGFSAPPVLGLANRVGSGPPPGPPERMAETVGLNPPTGLLFLKRLVRGANGCEGASRATACCVGDGDLGT